MSTLEAILLGLIQGVTEFLPVSSSGHLELGQVLLGFEQLNTYVLFDLVCHLGTLLAILIIFFPQIRATATTDRTKLLQVFLATLPLFALIPIMKPVKATFDQPQYLGFFFLLTATLLYAGMYFKTVKPKDTLQKSRWRDALTIGIFQVIAIFPGVSRSGSTISAGWMLGWDRRDAVTFSFLLAIPTILGGISFELLQLLGQGEGKFPPSIGPTQYIAGFVSSFAFGYAALLLLIRLAMKEKFMYFVWYCLALGILTTWYFYGRG